MGCLAVSLMEFITNFMMPNCLYFIIYIYLTFPKFVKIRPKFQAAKFNTSTGNFLVSSPIPPALQIVFISQIPCSSRQIVLCACRHGNRPNVWTNRRITSQLETRIIRKIKLQSIWKPTFRLFRD